MLNGEIPAYLGRQGWAKAEAGDGNIMDHDGDGILERMAKFELDSVRQLLSEGREVEITITGACDGIGFMGTTYIRVINRGRAAKR